MCAEQVPLFLAEKRLLLLSLPFNCFLLWELINWGRAAGCKQMDMGGVTEGGPNDPLQGITRFKRGLTENEIEIGREMIYLARPLRHRFYKWLKQIRELKRNNEELSPIYD